MSMDHSDAIAQGAAADLTIGDLARRTGLTPAVIRMWESRHGFPDPRRLRSGHRRYAESDVDVILQILRRKEAGVRLDAAMAEVGENRALTSPSIFAELKRRHPLLAVQRLRKSTLIGLSRAIEDECCATADRPVLFGAFQRSDRYAPSAARWTELSRVARSTIVFADHDDALPLAPGGPTMIHLACLSAWELPGQTALRDRDRLFEALWTVDPLAVRDAARVAARVAADAGDPTALILTRELADPPSRRETNANAANSLFNRAIGYVDRLG
jgi:DNA-binding transcriptional MerR regulator